MDLLKRALPYLELGSALVAAALWSQQAGVLRYAGQRLDAWPLALLAIPWLLRLALVRPLVRPRLIDLGLALFLASAALGVWAAYDRGPAWAKFWMIVAAVALCYAIAHQPALPS